MIENGFINLYKERGYTSNDSLRVLKGILKIKKLGHTGTLDPEAEGVLPVCIGKGTKLSELLVQGGKAYRASLRFGAITDTQDFTGKVLKTFTYTFQEEKVREAAASFEGGYLQETPMYSARKVQGKKLYELARKGVEVPRKKVEVMIRDLKIHSLDKEGMTFSVKCSKGTYIRTLIQDLGLRLGYGAYMTSLVRTQVGPFELQDSLTLSKIEHLAKEGEADQIIKPLSFLLQDYPMLQTLPEDDRYLLNGNPLTLEIDPEAKAGELFQMRTSEGLLSGLYQLQEIRDGKGSLRAYRMLI